MYTFVDSCGFNEEGRYALDLICFSLNQSDRFRLGVGGGPEVGGIGGGGLGGGGRRGMGECEGGGGGFSDDYILSKIFRAI